MPGEQCDVEELQSSLEDSFTVNLFYIIIDKVIQTMEDRFEKQKSLYLTPEYSVKSKMNTQKKLLRESVI